MVIVIRCLPPCAELPSQVCVALKIATPVTINANAKGFLKSMTSELLKWDQRASDAVPYLVNISLGGVTTLMENSTFEHDESFCWVSPLRMSHRIFSGRFESARIFGCGVRKAFSPHESSSSAVFQICAEAYTLFSGPTHVKSNCSTRKIVWAL